DGRREHGDADRLDRPDGRRHHREDQVEVVDHQIEDDVHVRATLAELRQPLALDEARLHHSPAQRADRRIEALEVPDLEHTPAPSTRALPSPTDVVSGFSIRTSMPELSRSQATG